MTNRLRLFLDWLLYDSSDTALISILTSIGVTVLLGLVLAGIAFVTLLP